MVDEGILTSDQLTQALAEQDRTGQPLGEILVELGFASPGAVANSLAEQHGGLLKTEYGVSAGLRTVSDAGLANAPVRPLIPVQDDRQSAEESDGQGEPVGLRGDSVVCATGDGRAAARATPVVEQRDQPTRSPTRRRSGCGVRHASRRHGRQASCQPAARDAFRSA